MEKRIIIISFLILLFVLVIGGSFAIFTKESIQEDTNSINTLNCLDVSIEGTENLVLTNMYPIKDEEGLLQKPYHYTITNNCETPVIAEINLEAMTTIPLTLIKVNHTNLTDNYTDVLENLASKTSSLEGSISKNLDMIYLNGNGKLQSSASFELRLWISYNATIEDLSNKTYTSRIVVNAKPAITTEPNWNAQPNTLLYAIEHGNYTYLNEPLTIPAQSKNALSENVISKTEDDYGTSFYFRGNIKNNYVIFANRCWKIVRVNGDGSIKIWLWNNDSTDCKVTNTPNSMYLGSTILYNKDSGGTGKVRQTASGIGFMYGKPDSTTLYTLDNTGAQDNVTDNTMLKNLKSWYDNAFETSDNANPFKYTNLLADTIWCGDKSISSGKGYGQYKDAPTYFMPVSRVSVEFTPSLICPEFGLDGKISKYTAQDVINGNGMLKTTINENTKYYKIGLLTADEAAFAGGKVGNNGANNNYYLYTGYNYWTMSANRFDSNRCIGYVVRQKGYLSNYDVNSNFKMNPTISLIPTVSITSGDGTVNNPYVINV